MTMGEKVATGFLALVLLGMVFKNTEQVTSLMNKFSGITPITGGGASTPFKAMPL